MARATASTTTVPLRRSGRNSSKAAKEEEQDVKIKPEAIESPRGVAKRIASVSPTPARHGNKRVKKEPQQKRKSSSTSTPKKSQDEKAAELQARKLKAYTQYANASPFPDFARPTPDECKLAHRILASLHGAKTRPSEPITKAPANRAGCGDAPSVLDALVRTVLSQNTSDRNSSRAKLSMDQVYGGSDKWEAIAYAKYGKYSLDHLFEKSDEDAMAEMLGFQGVGPKTASCVLLFCMRRESFAVDTHVYRLTGLLGWLPQKGGKIACNREQAQAHLDARVPAEDKYGLHVLLIRHGKDCAECKAGGRSTGKCELRKAFRGAKVDGEVGEELKEEEIEHVKEEVDGVETDRDAVANTIEMMS
ncbi:DNA glycosylase [Apiospora sp. TS-2023a]